MRSVERIGVIGRRIDKALLEEPMDRDKDYREREFPGADNRDRCAVAPVFLCFQKDKGLVHSRCHKIQKGLY